VTLTGMTMFIGRVLPAFFPIGPTGQMERRLKRHSNHTHHCSESSIDPYYVLPLHLRQPKIDVNRHPYVEPGVSGIGSAMDARTRQSLVHALDISDSGNC
jgi:hypothetical protein